MPEITVWTKQNAIVMEQLTADGRFIADERYIRRELDDTADIMLYIYRWLVQHAPDTEKKPPDVTFPVWVSFKREAAMLPEPGYVVLQLKMSADKVISLDIAKWSMITNYSYIPADKSDEREHKSYMRELGIDNATAVMTQFYPEAKKKIISSWDRLFDESVCLGSRNAYGLVWEVKKEWIQEVIM